MNKFRRFSAIGIASAVCIGAPMAANAGSARSTAGAKVSEAAARATALAAVPAGIVQSAELEIEHGKQVWSFDIKDAQSANVVEVQVDARTGAIVSKKVESVKDQKKEALADQKNKR